MQLNIPLPSPTILIGIWLALKAGFAIYLCKKEFQHIPFGSAISSYTAKTQFPNASFLAQNTLHKMLGAKIRNYFLACLINPELFVLKILMFIPLALLAKFLGKKHIEISSAKQMECEECNDTKLIHNHSFVSGGKGEWQYCLCRKPEEPEKVMIPLDKSGSRSAISPVAGDECQRCWGHYKRFDYNRPQCLKCNKCGHQVYPHLMRNALEVSRGNETEQQKTSSMQEKT